MKNIIQALSKPENSAIVSIFVPGELLTAAGLTPYSVEAMSCFIAGTRCEQTFLRKTEEEGFPETMCSYHRVFLGAALSGLVPKPKCMIYTNLACDSNMMTFPYLKQTNVDGGILFTHWGCKGTIGVSILIKIVYLWWGTALWCAWSCIVCVWEVQWIEDVFVITGHYFILYKKEKPYQFSDVKTEKR